MYVEINDGLIEKYVEILQNLDEIKTITKAIEQKKEEIENLIKKDVSGYIEENYKDSEDFFDYIMAKELHGKSYSEEGNNTLRDLLEARFFNQIFTLSGESKKG